MKRKLLLFILAFVLSAVFIVGCTGTDKAKKAETATTETIQNSESINGKDAGESSTEPVQQTTEVQVESRSFEEDEI